MLFCLFCGAGKSGFKSGGSGRGKSGYYSKFKPRTGRNSRDQKRRGGGSVNRSNSRYKEKEKDDTAKKGENSCFLDFCGGWSYA